MASRRSTRLGSRSATHPAIDPLTPLLTAASESMTTESSPSSSKKVTLTKSSSRKPSLKKRRSVSKSRKPSVRKGRQSAGSTTSLEILKDSSSGGRHRLVEASTSISPKSREAWQSSAQGSQRKTELPLPLDVLWLALCTLISFLYALAAVQPEHMFNEYAIFQGGVMRSIVPFGGVGLLFLRCSLIFLLGSLPIRYWAMNHFTETHIGSDLIVFAIVGVIKLALIQLFMFKSNEAFYQAAMLHASLGFAVQEFLININSSTYTSNLQRIIEIIGNSMILFVTVDDLSLKAMAYTLTTLTLAKVLRAFILIASSRESYRAFRKAVSFGHIALLSFGMPFIINYLMQSAREMNNDDNPTYAHILGPFICAGVLISSMILSHIDYLFN